MNHVLWSSVDQRPAHSLIPLLHSFPKLLIILLYSRFPFPIPDPLVLSVFELIFVDARSFFKAGSTSYELKRHPEYKTNSASLKADIQTQAQFMKINDASVDEFMWKSSYFVVGLWVDPCMFGKCLTDIWLENAKARKKIKEKKTVVFLRQPISLTQPLKLNFYLSSSPPEKSTVDILLRAAPSFIHL